MSTSAAEILRLMLDKGCVPPMNLLCLVFLHLVKTEIGAYIACNYLPQVCDFYICLKDKKAQSVDVVKPDASIFSLVLDACVRKDIQKPCSIAIGARKLRVGLKIHIESELLQNDSVVKPEEATGSPMD
ncbi:Pentatricopeptide repeat-containing protein [Arachis hypogaea]|nr:Pentatricopeptide repeat-containing protein [Arachis hypogaea]